MTRRAPSMALIYAVTINGVTVNTLTSPAIPDILTALAAPRGLAGVVVASASLPGIVLAPVIGVLADRYGRREVLVPCLIAFGVAGGLSALAPDIWTFVGLRLLQGAGSAGLVNLGVVLIGDHWTGVERSKRIGRNAAVLTVAVAIFPMLGGTMVQLGGWQAPFLLYPFSLVTAFNVLRGLPRTKTRDSTVRQQIGEVLPVLKAPAVAGLLTSGVIVFVLFFGLVLTVLPLYLEQRFGLGPAARGVVIGLPSVTAVVASLLLGRLERRLGKRWLLAGASVIFGAGFGLTAIPLLGLVLAGALVYGFGQGVLIPALQDVAAGIGPPTTRGTVVAVWVGAVRAGQTAGPLLAGALLVPVGAGGLFAMGAALSVALGVAFAVVGPKATRTRARDWDVPPA